MLMKAVGGICVFCGALWLGLYQGNLLRRREKYLQQVSVFLHLLEVEIEFSVQRLSEIFRRLSSRTEIGALPEDALEHMESEGIRSAWEHAVDRQCGCLLREDREVLKLLGAELGMTDRENQIKNIRHIEKLTEKQYEEARQRRQRLCRLYEGGGALVGLLLVVLMI